MSEVLLGLALRDVPRESYLLCTKLGRYDLDHFDFSARRVKESVDVSLHRLGTDHLDIALCHDIEFVPMQQIVDETLPALKEVQKQGKVRYIGFSGYPQKIFKFIIDQIDVDCVLSYNQYTLQNTRFMDETVPYLQSKGVGVMNAGAVSPVSSPMPCPPGSRNQKASRRRQGTSLDFVAREARISPNVPSNFPSPTRNHHNHCGECQSREHSKVGAMGSRTHRCSTP